MRSLLNLLTSFLPTKKEDEEIKKLLCPEEDHIDNLIKSPISQLLDLEEQEELEEDCKNTASAGHIGFILDLSDEQHAKLGKYINHCMGIRETKIDLHIANILDIINRNNS